MDDASKYRNPLIQWIIVCLNTFVISEIYACTKYHVISMTIFDLILNIINVIMISWSHYSAEEISTCLRYNTNTYINCSYFRIHVRIHVSAQVREITSTQPEAVYVLWQEPRFATEHPPRLETHQPEHSAPSSSLQAPFVSPPPFVLLVETS